MATNILSRFLPPTRGEPSIYETLRQYDELDLSDIEERAGMAVDEEDVGTRFRDQEDIIADSAIQIEPVNVSTRPVSRRPKQRSPDRTRTRQAKGTGTDEFDDEVPQSLLIEGEQEPTFNEAEHRRVQSPPVLGPSSRGIRAKWQATRKQQRLYQDIVPPPVAAGQPARDGRAMVMDPKERALWMWANVENLDNFLAEVYEYYTGNGIWSITLTRMLNLTLVTRPSC